MDWRNVGVVEYGETRRIFPFLSFNSRGANLCHCKTSKATTLKTDEYRPYHHPIELAKSENGLHYPVIPRGTPNAASSDSDDGSSTSSDSKSGSSDSSRDDRPIEKFFRGLMKIFDSSDSDDSSSDDRRSSGDSSSGG
jgi:hypothetical protein